MHLEALTIRSPAYPAFLLHVYTNLFVFAHKVHLELQVVRRFSEFCVVQSADLADPASCKKSRALINAD